MNWKIALALFAPVAVMGGLAGGCGTDVCTRADDQIAACASPTVTLPSMGNNTTNECTPKRACQSECINSASCVDLNEAQCIGQVACRPLTGPPSTFTLCMNACEGK
jgi:hypothetical protein